MSTSSESLDFLRCWELSVPGDFLSGCSGTWTESGNGEVGSGLCDDRAVPLLKFALVGVVASSTRSGGWGCKAELGVGVAGDASLVAWFLYPWSLCAWSL